MALEYNMLECSIHVNLGTVLIPRSFSQGVYSMISESKVYEKEFIETVPLYTSRTKIHLLIVRKILCYDLWLSPNL